MKDRPQRERRKARGRCSTAAESAAAAAVSEDGRDCWMRPATWASIGLSPSNTAKLAKASFKSPAAHTLH